MTLGVTALAWALGDQRQVAVVLAQPGPGESVASTTRAVALTFDAEPERARIEQAFQIEPAVPGAFRWRGRTMVYTLAEPLQTGEYRVSVAPGKLGRGGESLRQRFELTFTVREPGVALIVANGDQQELVEVRPGAEARTLVAAPRIIDYAISPDGTQVAVVVADSEGWGGLVTIRLNGGLPKSLVQTPEINVGGVTWAPDASALLVVRRDRLPSGGQGVPRVWLMRISGEFVAPVDPDGNPSLNAAWSPDNQQLVYVSPSDARVIAVNLGTQQLQNLGQPRGGTPVWSPDSRLVAFESVASSGGSNPEQPIRIKSLDGAVDRSYGEPGETRSAPIFLNDETLLSLRRMIGVDRTGTDLVFESTSDGSRLRMISLAKGTGLVLHWDLDPSGEWVVFSVLEGRTTRTFILNLDSGEREELVVGGARPRWLP